MNDSKKEIVERAKSQLEQALSNDKRTEYHVRQALQILDRLGVEDE